MSINIKSREWRGCKWSVCLLLGVEDHYTAQSEKRQAKKQAQAGLRGCAKGMGMGYVERGSAFTGSNLSASAQRPPPHPSPSPEPRIRQGCRELSLAGTQDFWGPGLMPTPGPQEPQKNDMPRSACISNSQFATDQGRKHVQDGQLGCAMHSISPTYQAK